MKIPAFKRIEKMLNSEGYITEKSIVMSVYLSMQLNKPLLVEGPAGVGKTEIAKVMARALQTELIRLQCYEGLDATHALYEWNYQRQLLHIKLSEKSGQTVAEREKTIFSDEFLHKRPILKAITRTQSCVLLIDEIDRADEEFESFLLEVLADWQVTIPEIGTINATQIPHVVVTSNRVRELSDALRRRCLYLWIDYPDFDRELAIVRAKVPKIDQALAEQICQLMQEVRKMRLDKVPGVAETIDWLTALTALHKAHLDEELIRQTLGIVLKDWQDLKQVQIALPELLGKVNFKPAA